jgi:phosphoribosyl-ATP pyrophosphohydrolase/phosphoribosyl-AMP cyclohydrolase
MSPLPPIDPLLNAVRFDPAGLVVAIAVDATSGVVRMVAYASAEALRATASSGLATFWSRSRNELWQKGATSGNALRVREVRVDCDGDAVLYVVDAEGPACHTGKPSCFYRVAGADGTLVEDEGPVGAPAAVLAQVANVIATRRRSSAEKSYVKSLLDAGFPKINAKITEEAREVTEALPSGDRAHAAHEAADVVFHLLVGLEAAGVPVEDVFAELRRRFGTSGHAEKASRAPKQS